MFYAPAAAVKFFTQLSVHVEYFTGKPVIFQKDGTLEYLYMPACSFLEQNVGQAFEKPS